ncbi:MAG: hypothetical protein HY931_03260 [Candidatus Falkowbacteria bacterium]|nr:MAG: hypothetical protein HY931_03260 [Candidatus Falkowbacteria bacterium]
MKNVSWSFWSLIGHLLICLIATQLILNLMIPAIPASAPYAIVFNVSFCLGVISVWYAKNFDMDSWHVGAYLALIAILAIIFLFSTFDWILGFDLIPVPWRYVAVFESLPLASMFIGFLIIIAADISFWPAGKKYSGERQPA